MGNAFQDALGDAFEALTSDASLRFKPAIGCAFTAWPIEQPLDVDTRLLASPDVLNWYQSRACPVFKNGDVLTREGVAFTVIKRYPADPYTKAFKFAISAGRTK